MVESGTLLRCYTSLTGYRGFESLLLRSYYKLIAEIKQKKEDRTKTGPLFAYTKGDGQPGLGVLGLGCYCASPFIGSLVPRFPA